MECVCTVAWYELTTSLRKQYHCYKSVAIVVVSSERQNESMAMKSSSLWSGKIDGCGYCRQDVLLTSILCNNDGFWAELMFHSFASWLGCNMMLHRIEICCCRLGLRTHLQLRSLSALSLSGRLRRQFCYWFLRTLTWKWSLLFLFWFLLTWAVATPEQS